MFQQEVLVLMNALASKVSVLVCAYRLRSLLRRPFVYQCSCDINPSAKRTLISPSLQTSLCLLLSGTTEQLVTTMSSSPRTYQLVSTAYGLVYSMTIRYMIALTPSKWSCEKMAPSTYEVQLPQSSKPHLCRGVGNRYSCCLCVLVPLSP